ncbi:MAG: helix-turn-helix transcriptional regulator [Planctomycetota bacterium]
MPTLLKATREAEALLTDAERVLGISLVLIDHRDALRYPGGTRPLLGQRQSHQRNAVCRIGFSPRCVAHCRHAMHERGAAASAPFVHTCWKGISEVAVPLHWHGVFIGNLYAGSWRGGVPPRLPADFATAWRTLGELDPEYARRLGALLAVFAQGWMEHLDRATPLGARVGGREAEIRQILREQIGQHLSLALLARRLGLSASRTRHLVRDIFGRSFRALLADERLFHATELLRRSDLPISAVAAQVGLPDPRNFTRVFTKRFGFPPGAWRRRERGTST